MRRIGRVSLLVVAISVVISGPSAGASAGTVSKVLGARAAATPKGYQVVVATGLSVANDHQAGGAAECPAKTVVLGGGVQIDTNSLQADVNSSWPQGNRTWAVDVNNTTGVTTNFEVYAVCAHKPTGYQQVKGTTEDNAAGEQDFGAAACPSGKKILGGGAFSGSSSTAVAQSSSVPAKLLLPPAYAWEVTMNNASTSDEDFYAEAICAKVPGYKLKTGPPATDKAGAISVELVTCPSGTVPLGGGIGSDDTPLGANINTSAPSGSAWTGWMANSSPDDVTVRTAVACAS